MGNLQTSAENARAPDELTSSGPNPERTDTRETHGTPPSKWVVRLRLAVLILGVSILYGAPALHQIGRVRHPALWHWQLYSRHHEKVCETRWTYETVRGVRKPIDRADLLGATSYATLPQSQRTVTAGALTRMNKRVCDGVRARHPAVDLETVRLEARCTAFKQWVEIDDGSHAVCERGGAAHLAKAPAKLKAANDKVWRRERRLGGKR